MYTGYGIEYNGVIIGVIIIFGVKNSSSSHAGNRKKNVLVLTF